MNETKRPKGTPIWAQMTLGGFFAVVGVDSAWDLIDRVRAAEEAAIYTAGEMRKLMENRSKIEQEVRARLKAIEEHLDLLSR